MKTTARGAQFKLLWKEEVLPIAVVEAAKMGLQPASISPPYFSAAPSNPRINDDRIYSQLKQLFQYFFSSNEMFHLRSYIMPSLGHELFQGVSSLVRLKQ